MINDRFLNKFFTSLMIVFPILHVYSIGGTSFMVADFFLVILTIFLIYCSYKGNDSISVSSEILPFFIYVCFFTIISAFLEDEKKIIGSSLRYCFYLSTLFFWNRNYFNVNLGVRIYTITGIIATTYLIIQFFLYRFFSFFLPGVINNPLFPVISNQIGSLNDNLKESWFVVLRPSSFFAEPAHYSEYALGLLTILLFKERNFKMSLFISFGILVSMASTGILLLFVVWIIYIGFQIKKRFSLKALFTFFIFIPSFLWGLTNSFFFEYFLKRMSDGRSSSGRFDGYGAIFDSINDLSINLFFGNGMNSSLFHTYLAGFARLFSFYGILGTSFFILSSILILKSTNILHWQKMLFIVFLLLNIGTELMFQPVLFVFLCFVLSKFFGSVNFFILQEKKQKESPYEYIIYRT